MIDYSLENVKLTFGAHSLKNKDSTVETRHAKKVVIHKDYWNNTLNDIAMIKWTKPLEYNEYIRPACFPSRDVIEGDNVTMTGWGESHHKNGTGFAKVLQYVDMKVLGHPRNSKVCWVQFGSSDKYRHF